MSSLSGMTLLRYGHLYDSGGGMEQYLADLNGALHRRNALTTLQVQMTSNTENVGEHGEPVPQGSFTRVSLYVPQASHERAIAGNGHHAGLGAVTAKLRHRLLSAPGIYPLVTRPRLQRRRAVRRDGEPENAGAVVASLMDRHAVDLVVLHSAGGADAAEVIAEARRRNIPVTYVHHFSNDRLDGLAMRHQCEAMPVVAGVNGVGVPSFLRGRFVNVSDGIDTEFFNRRNAKPLSDAPSLPVIFLPARITPTKGQRELILAVAELRRAGVDAVLVLAGRVDSGTFESELRALIAEAGLQDRVRFVGMLDAAGLRDWYAVAAAVAFPTRHHEGLPRILMECQAMEVPPVVHDIGGTREGVLDGETGHVVRVGDDAALVARLRELLTDAARRRRMGSAGRELVLKRFSLDALATRHEQLCLRAIGARTSKARVPSLNVER